MTTQCTGLRPPFTAITLDETGRMDVLQLWENGVKCGVLVLSKGAGAVAYRLFVAGDAPPLLDRVPAMKEVTWTR